MIGVTDGTSFWEMKGNDLSCKTLEPAQAEICKAETQDAARTLLQKKGIDAADAQIFAKERVENHRLG